MLNVRKPVVLAVPVVVAICSSIAKLRDRIANLKSANNTRGWLVRGSRWSFTVEVSTAGFIISNVARVFRPAGVARGSFAGLKTCATSGERGSWFLKPVLVYLGKPGRSNTIGRSESVHDSGTDTGLKQMLSSHA